MYVDSRALDTPCELKNFVIALFTNIWALLRQRLPQQRSKLISLIKIIGYSEFCLAKFNKNQIILIVKGTMDVSL